ncbi:hypothetical protein GQ42DRAFT_12444 [Ramicandelaber brevisporus]|nr:hypothetical protein GQ42DRAFT_12444 [Ramicandelaber brevisporus]
MRQRGRISAVVAFAAVITLLLATIATAAVRAEQQQQQQQQQSQQSQEQPHQSVPIKHLRYSCQPATPGGADNTRGHQPQTPPRCIRCTTNLVRLPGGEKACQQTGYVEHVRCVWKDDVPADVRSKYILPAVQSCIPPESERQRQSGKELPDASNEDDGNGPNHIEWWTLKWQMFKFQISCFALLVCSGLVIVWRRRVHKAERYRRHILQAGMSR